MNLQSQSSNLAVNTATDILKSDALARLWNINYASRKDDNPIHPIIDKIKSYKDAPINDPSLITFMRALINIERKANKNKDKELSLFLENIAKQLDMLPVASIEIDDLPEDQQRLLACLSDATGQTPIEPVRATWKLMKAYGLHIYDHAKDHPVSVSALALVSIGLIKATFANGSNATMYIDPNILSCDMDALSMFKPETLTCDPAQIPKQMAAICHDNLNSAFGNTIGGWIKDVAGSSDMLLPHCARMKTLASDAQGILKGGFDTLYSRMDVAMLNPILDLGDKIVPALSQMQGSFYAAAHNTAEFWYKVDAIENIMLHGVITGTSAILTHKIGHMDKSEFLSIWNKTKDFFKRIAIKTPLNYLLMASGSLYAYSHYNGAHPSIIWAGAFGAISGQIIHNQINKLRAPAFVHQTLMLVDKNITSHPATQNFSTIQPDYILSSTRAHEPSIQNKVMSWKTIRKPFKIAAAAAASLAATIDVMLNDGHSVASVIGSGMVTGSYFLVNIPQDAGLHVIFTALGVAIGTATRTSFGIAGLTTRSIRKMLKSKEDNNALEPR